MWGEPHCKLDVTVLFQCSEEKRSRGAGPWCGGPRGLLGAPYRAPPPPGSETVRTSGAVDRARDGFRGPLTDHNMANYSIYLIACAQCPASCYVFITFQGSIYLSADSSSHVTLTPRPSPCTSSGRQVVRAAPRYGTRARREVYGVGDERVRFDDRW